MAVPLVQLQAPDTGLYSIPWTDCTDKPSGAGAEMQHYNKETLFTHGPTSHVCQTLLEKA